MHVHHSQDEWFFVRHGSFAFRVGDQMFHLGPGDSLLGPQGVPHAFVNLSDDSALTITFVPAGTIEQLFLEICDISRSRPPTLEDWSKISRDHDIEIIGPPLDPANLLL